MFGDRIMVAPKLKLINEVYLKKEMTYNVKTYLPEISNWYFYYTKERE